MKPFVATSGNALDEPLLVLAFLPGSFAVCVRPDGGMTVVYIAELTARTRGFDWPNDDGDVYVEWRASKEPVGV